jgi:nitroreductase/SAM-dependent methyltransferase
MELIDILKKRRSVRAFLPKKVRRGLIEKLIKAAQQSPVSCNLQLTQYVAVDDKELLKKLGRDVSYKFKYAPTVIVVLVDSRFTVERASAITGVGMAVENMILRAVDLGLATCPMAGFGKDEVIKKYLNIPSHMDVVLLLAVGFQDETVSKELITKLSSKNVFNFNTYGDLKTINGSNRLEDHTPESIIDYRSRIAPVYLDRFRLSSFNEKYYKTIVTGIKNILPKSNGEKSVLARPSRDRWLDLMSYDGEFIRNISETEISKQYKFWVSDYIPANLAFLKKKFKLSIIQIDSSNNIPTKEKFDVISFITQLDFTPENKNLLRSAASVLNKDGLLFISVIRNHWYKRLIFFLMKLPRYIKGKHNNIYEGNTYYKIGPHTHQDLWETTTFLDNSGLKLIVDKSFNFYRNGVKVKLLVFKSGLK